MRAPISVSLWLLLTCVLGSIFMTSAIQYTKEIETHSGKLRGFVETLPTTKARVQKYLGIPFAKAERFKKPVDPPKWTDVKNMTSFGKVCYQLRRTSPFGYNLTDMSEDCLNLNVFVPDKQTKSKLPVMVWIHGGAYLINSNRIADGSYLATIGEVIVVPINYRLGTLGFLSAKEYGFTGNYGLYDQLAALKWVNRNIEQFGGDPYKVTIFGNSAGGASVSLLSLSPLARGLFKYAIMQSGVGTTSQAYTEYKGKAAAEKYFREKFNCKASANDTDNRSITDCINAVDAVKIFDTYAYRQPVIKEEFLPDKPEELIKHCHRINPESVLIGVADDDGSCFTDAIPALSSGSIPFFDPIKDKPTLEKEIMKTTFLSRSANNNPLYAPAVLCRYTTASTNFTDPNINRNILLDIATHAFFIAPAVAHADDFSRHVKTYFYDVRYGLPMPGYFNIPSSINAYHETEKFMVFGFPLKDPKLECSVGSGLSRELIRIWSNFAKTGDVNSPSKSDYYDGYWSQYEPDKKNYMVIQPEMEMDYNLLPDFVNFWNNDVNHLNITISQICGGRAPVPKMPPPKSDTQDRRRIGMF